MFYISITEWCIALLLVSLIFYAAGFFAGRRRKKTQEIEPAAAVVMHEGEEELAPEQVAALRYMEWRRNIENDLVFLINSHWQLAAHIDDLAVTTTEPDSQTSTVEVVYTHKTVFLSWRTCIDWKRGTYRLYYWGTRSADEGNQVYSEVFEGKIGDHLVSYKDLSAFLMRTYENFQADAPDEEDFTVGEHLFPAIQNNPLIAFEMLERLRDEGLDKVQMSELFDRGLKAVTKQEYKEALCYLSAFSYFCFYNDGDDFCIDALLKQINLHDALGLNEEDEALNAEDDDFTTDAQLVVFYL